MVYDTIYNCNYSYLCSTTQSGKEINCFSYAYNTAIVLARKIRCVNSLHTKIPYSSTIDERSRWFLLYSSRFPVHFPSLYIESIQARWIHRYYTSTRYIHGGSAATTQPQSSNHSLQKSIFSALIKSKSKSKSKSKQPTCGLGFYSAGK